MYSFIFKYILNPVYERILKRRKVLEYRSSLEKSQWWSHEKLMDVQFEHLKELLVHAQVNVPYWRDIFKNLGVNAEDINTYDDFRKLPIIDKDDIATNRSCMMAENFEGRTWTKATGGSTGTPLEFEYNPDSNDWRLAITKRGYGWAGCEDGIKQAYIWGTDIGNLPFLKEWKRKLHRWAYRQWFFNSFDFDDATMAQCLEQLNKIKPVVIVGYTNPLVHFAKFIKQQGGIKFHPHSVITGAEKLHPFQRKILEEVFGCEVFNTYGSREFMLMASECSEHAGLHIHSENVVFEIIKEDGTPAQEGETGEIVVTDLHNYGMPFIRYRIGDLGVATDQLCPCKRGLPLLKDVVGRSLDLIRTRDGRAIPGEFFPHLMKEFEGIKQFQVVQNSIEEVVIKIVKDESWKEERFDFMKEEVYKVLGESIDVKYEFVENIPLTPSGKRKVAVSNLN